MLRTFACHFFRYLASFVARSSVLETALIPDAETLNRNVLICFGNTEGVHFDCKGDISSPKSLRAWSVVNVASSALARRIKRQRQYPEHST